MRCFPIRSRGRRTIGGAPRATATLRLHRPSPPRAARRAEGDVIELFLNAEEAAQGGMVVISMRVPVRCSACHGGAGSCPGCGGRGTVQELFSAWLAVPPGVADGAMLAPSELLRGMTRPVRFRMRVRAKAQA
jgi:DnaJ-class molecular chaperone